MDKALPMNGGAEAVETAFKAMRCWAYNIKKVPDGLAQIITFENCFHGRTPGAVAASSDEDHVRRGFGPFLPGFIRGVKYGDLRAFEEVLQQNASNVAGVFIEPIQGEAGVVIPPPGYLAGVQALCKKYNVLFVVDEIQSGFGRTGKNFATDDLPERPDGMTIGKAMGGGLFPVSAFLAKKELMDVITPGSHGSTFSGNPLACAVTLATIELMNKEHMAERSAEMGEKFLREIQKIDAGFITNIRGEGSWIGIELASEAKAADFCHRMVIDHFQLCKDAHCTVRISPPFTSLSEDMNRLALAVQKTEKAMKTEIGPRIQELTL